LQYLQWIKTISSSMSFLWLVKTSLKWL